MSSATPATIRVQCPRCDKPLKLNASLLGKQIKCPLCGGVFATQAKPPVQQTTTTQPVPKPVVSKPVVSKPTAAMLAPLDPFNFPPSEAGLGSPALSHARTIPTSRSRSKGSFQAGKFLKKYGLHSIVSLVAIMTLVLSLIAPWPFLIVGIVEMVLGAIVVGLLFVPRFHIMRGLFGAMGNAGDLFLQSAATIGSGGVAVIVVLAIVKALRRSNRSGASLDFSGLTGEGVMAFLLIPFSLAAMVALWYLIGLMRTIAGGYLLQCSFMLLILLVSTMQNPDANRGGAMPPTDPVFRVPPRPEGGPLPRPYPPPGAAVVDSPNPLGRPTAEVIHFVIDTTKIRNVEMIRSRLIGTAPPSLWNVSQNESQLEIWLHQIAPVDLVAQRVSGDGFLVLEGIDPATRTIRLRGE